MLQFNVEGDWNHRAVWGGDQISYGRRKESWKGYFRKGKLPARGRWVRIEVPASEVGLEPGQMVSGMAFSQFGGKVLWDEAGVLTGQVAPPMVMEALALPPESRTARQKKAIEDHQERTTPEVVAARRAIEALAAEREKVEADAPVVMYTKALETPRVVRILPRGNWLDESGEIVEPAIPAFMGKIKRSGRATRLDLARWLVTPAAQGGAGELTARVFVNRVWAILFGEGLCPSTEDFGGQGVPPTHLGLLDRLALDFVASGWDVKTLVRSLVLTRTYGLSSVPSPAMVAKDPMNLLFARQMRRRLPAESVRDTLLAISGLLNRDVGGRSVKPPQPAGYYRHLNFPTRRYRADTGPAQWRRGVYVHWQRQYLHPMLRAFDAPTREECTARRPVSNTPLAALTLLNDPVFVEASRALARRLIALEGADAADRIRAGLKMATGRVASDAEVAVLRTLLDVSRDRYGSDAKVAAAFVGEPKPSPGSERELAERAAWTQVARAILNLHETITRE